MAAIRDLFGSTLHGWWDDDAPRLGASLAYYTLFAIAPILLVATAVAGMAFGAEAVRGEIVGQLDDLVGHEGARAVQGLLQGASQRRTGVLATAVGSLTFVIAATGAFLELQSALNTIWRVKRTPGAHLHAFLLDRVRSFGLVVAVGFLLMVSLAVTAALAALNGWLASRAPGVPLPWGVVSLMVSLVVTTGLFALLFRILPDVQLRWRDVTTGAFVTAVLFAVGQQLIGLYLGQSSMTSTYGAAGSVMILLLWVYYSCQILLFGAEFTRAYAERRGMTLQMAARPRRTSPGFVVHGDHTATGETMTIKDKLEIGVKENAPYRKDNLPDSQVRGPEIPTGPGRSPEIPQARSDSDSEADVTMSAGTWDGGANDPSSNE